MKRRPNPFFYLLGREHTFFNHTTIDIRTTILIDSYQNKTKRDHKPFRLTLVLFR